MHLSRCAHSPGRRPHLILYKMLALSSLVLATTLLSTPTARAGTWQFTCTGSGTNTLTFGYPGTAPRITHWTPPGPQTGRFDLGSTLGDSSDYSVSDTATLTVTVTATWQSDPNLPSDPAPPKVWLCESAQANWSEGHSGSAADGLSDPYQAQVPGPGGASSSDTAPAAIPPTHWTLKTVSGGTVTLPTRTPTAEADFSPTTSRPYGDFCTAHIASYSVTVHPQPYNFHQTLGQDNGDGTISFQYAWLSTSGGRITDLTSCYLHERVTYPGGNPYYPPLPFVVAPPGTPNPTVAPGALKNGILMTSTATNGDTHSPWPLSTNYSDFTSLTVSAAQRYEFDDIATGDTNLLVPGPDSTQTITRIIYPVGAPPSPDWWYKVTKNGVPSTKEVMPHP